MRSVLRLATILSGYDNPLIAKDAVSRMRSWRAPLAITLYIGLLGAVGFAVFTIQALTARDTHVVSATVGTTVFTVMAIFQLALVALFAPALAAGAISGERERQTFDVLLVSRVSAFAIVWGKLVASLAYLVLMILAALPLFATVFLFGGVDFEQFALAQLLTLTTAGAIGSVSLLFSAVFRRSLAATVTSYAASALATVGTLLAGFLLTLTSLLRAGGDGSSPDVHPLLFSNPVYALGALLLSANGNPMPAGRLLQLLFLGAGAHQRWGPLLQPWQLAVAVQLGITALAVGLSVWLVRGRRAPPPRGRVAAGPVEVAG